MLRGRSVAFVTVAVLVAAVAPPDARAARTSASVTATAPKVDVRAKSAHAFTKVSKTKNVRIGDLVRTSAAGLAQVDYGEGSYTRLDHHTKFVIKKLTNKAGDRRVKTTLISGRTFNRVEKITESESFEQTAGGATAGVVGTTFVVARDAEADISVFTLVEGTLNVRIPGETSVLLTSGQQIEVVNGVSRPVATFTLEELCADPFVKRNDSITCPQQSEIPGEAGESKTTPKTTGPRSSATTSPTSPTTAGGSPTTSPHTTSPPTTSPPTTSPPTTSPPPPPNTTTTTGGVG